jgi:type II secretory ATPase GspE/PulE/Tfp pilus assembly ATPase PilB-like protein
MKSLRERFTDLLLSQKDVKKNAWGGAASTNINANLSTDVVNLILTEAILMRTSDIHLEPCPDHIRIRFRVDGKLYDVLKVEHAANITLVSRIKVLSNLPVDAMSSRKAMDGRFTFSIGRDEVDFRVATFPTILGEKIALRLLRKDMGMINLKSIGLSPNDAMRLEKIIQRKSGLLVVSGPTGAGKTTTLYSLLARLHTPTVNIVTLEDPVEYQIDGMNQCDIRKKGDEGFAAGLKALLRQDPDIVLIGEIRDIETAEVAIRASISGHLVLTSLHANNALGTVIRLINMGLERYLVSYAVVGAVAQRLVPRICDSCRTPYKVASHTVERICEQFGLAPELFRVKKSATIKGDVQYVQDDDPNALDTPGDLVFYKGTGCDVCNGTGYRGRMGIYEVVIFTEELRDGLIRSAHIPELEKIARQNGYRSLAQDAVDKLLAGLVTIEDIYPVLLEKAV